MRFCGHQCRSRQMGSSHGSGNGAVCEKIPTLDSGYPHVKFVARKMRPNGELPSDHYADRRGHTPGVGRQAHLAVQRPAAFSGVKALRNTSAAKAAGRQALLAFRSLDPLRALRGPDRRRRDEEPPFPLRTKNWKQTANNSQRINCPATGNSPLTGKAPYKSAKLSVPSR